MWAMFGPKVPGTCRLTNLNVGAFLRPFPTSMFGPATADNWPFDATEGESPKDFRSPWLFKAVGVANFVLLPVVGIYAAFYWDWGDDREHVMQPVRRWLRAQRDTFFSLSPPEQELATPGLTLPPLQSDVSLTEAPSAELPKGFFKPFFLVKAVDPEGPAAIAWRINHNSGPAGRRPHYNVWRDPCAIVTAAYLPSYD
ncbi:hypothetical protein B0H10DRAFT_1945134 [Mycena sp. CBHHK59/15]|nr:hypothetical protein B0H10DRAFT_1945134 [Mycena sp. CBHHK59/15]